MKNVAIFLDKDGTLVKDVPYNVDPEKIELLPGVIKGLSLLQSQGFKFIIISNQSGIARGYFTELQLSKAFQHLKNFFAQRNIHITDIYVCPHHPEGVIRQYAKNCDCRKPKPGLVLQAKEEHDILLSQSWMIGDILNDVEAGKSAGCKTILIDNGNETEWKLTPSRTPDYIVSNFFEAVLSIASTTKQYRKGELYEH